MEDQYTKLISFPYTSNEQSKKIGKAIPFAVGSKIKILRSKSYKRKVRLVCQKSIKYYRKN